MLCEGPLDAARVGPGGIALIGSSISPENAEKVASAFHVVFTAFDEDRAGKEATDRIGKMILGAKQRAPLVQMVVPMQIASGKDIGDMSQQAFDALLQKTLKRVKWDGETAGRWRRRRLRRSRFRDLPGQLVARDG